MSISQIIHVSLSEAYNTGSTTDFYSRINDIYMYDILCDFFGNGYKTIKLEIEDVIAKPYGVLVASKTSYQEGKFYFGVTNEYDNRFSIAPTKYVHEIIDRDPSHTIDANGTVNGEVITQTIANSVDILGSIHIEQKSEYYYNSTTPIAVNYQNQGIFQFHNYGGIFLSNTNIPKYIKLGLYEPLYAQNTTTGSMNLIYTTASTSVFYPQQTSIVFKITGIN